MRSSTSSSLSRLSNILRRLESVDTAALCDADKSRGFNAIQVMSHTMTLRTNTPKVKKKKMIGIARTIQLTQPNDFLAVLYGLKDSTDGEILCVNTVASTKAVAGSMFLTEAERRGVRGLIVDGAVRDTSGMSDCGDGLNNIHCYSTSINPYSGTIQSLGTMQVKIECGGVSVSPGDVVMGDADGIIVADIESIENLIGTAEGIVAKEYELMAGMKRGRSLHSMTNFDEHVSRLRNGEESTLQFK